MLFAEKSEDKPQNHWQVRGGPEWADPLPLSDVSEPVGYGPQGPGLGAPVIQACILPRYSLLPRNQILGVEDPECEQAFALTTAA